MRSTTTRCRPWAILFSLISQQVEQFGSIAKVPANAVGNVRNDMYLASEALRWLLKDNKLDLSSEEVSAFKAYKASLDDATRFIPLWVKVAIAIALGLGTMIGWKRIVVTVGEKIGKQHLTYAQGASAELVAMGTISPPTLRPAGLDDPCAVLRRRGNHGGERLRPADGNRSQSSDGMGADAPHGHADFGQPVLAVHAIF